MALGTTRQQLAKGTLEIHEKPKGRFASFVMALVVMAGLGLLFTLIVVLPKSRDEPEVIVEVVVPEILAAPQMQKLNALKGFEKSFSMPAKSAFSRMMKASSHPLQVPAGILDELEIEVGPLGFGEDEFGAEGSGIGGGGTDRAAVSEGMKSGATFFGLGTGAKRIVYLIDLSEDAKPLRPLIEKELKRSISELTTDVQYAVIGYGPVPWRIGRGRPSSHDKGARWEVTYQGGKKVYERDPATRRYAMKGLPTSRSAGKWERSTPAASRDIATKLANEPSLGGHDWYNALTMAHNLDPKPEAIYFVVASGAGVPPGFAKIATYNRDQGNPAILGALLLTSRGVRELHKLSEASGGQTRLLLDRNSLRSVSAGKFLENPSNEMRFLGEFDLWLQWEKQREELGLK